MNSSDQPNPDVLIVDDKPDNLRVICGMLRERGFAVRPASSGRLAIDAAESRVPDVILMDINMPEMDGYQACIELKKRDLLNDIPIIFLSALGDTIDKVRGFESGGVDYITKPFKIEEVEARINTHITIRRLRQELQQRYDDLRHSEELRDKLTHMIVHDMRNPLAVVLSGLGFLIRSSETNSDDTTEEVLGMMDSQSGLLMRMINDLLDVSRLEQDKMPVDVQQSEVVALLDEVRSNVVLNGQTLQVETAKAPLMVCCDTDLVRRVLTNLISNAIKYTPSGGTVRLVVKPYSEGTRFEVEDTGRGIPSEYHEKIFEKFGQVCDDVRKSVPSTGLGLSFCRLAVEAHGGEIGVESDVGEGSLFWFTIPDEPVERSLNEELAPIPQTQNTYQTVSLSSGQ